MLLKWFIFTKCFLRDNHPDSKRITVLKWVVPVFQKCFCRDKHPDNKRLFKWFVFQKCFPREPSTGLLPELEDILCGEGAGNHPPNRGSFQCNSNCHHNDDDGDNSVRHVQHVQPHHQHHRGTRDGQAATLPGWHECAGWVCSWCCLYH